MRDEYAPIPTADERNRAMAESAREADIRSAVIKEKQRASKAGMRMSDEAALNNVYARIDVDGVDAVLPQFARITRRMQGYEYEGDTVPRTVLTYSSTKPGEDAPAAPAPANESQQVQSEIMRLNAANASDIAAGRSPDPDNYRRIEELRKLL